MVVLSFVFAGLVHADPRADAIAASLAFEHRPSLLERVRDDLAREGADFDATLWGWAFGEDPVLARQAARHLASTADATDRLADLFTIVERASGDDAWLVAVAGALDRVAVRSAELRTAIQKYARLLADDHIRARLVDTRAVAGDIGLDARELARWLNRSDLPRTQARVADFAVANTHPAALPTMIMVLDHGGPGLIPLLKALAAREYPRRDLRVLVRHVRRLKVDPTQPCEVRSLATRAVFRLRGGAERPHRDRALSDAWHQPVYQSVRQVRALVTGWLDHPRAWCERAFER